ncbi:MULTISPECIES: hypothetical protein [Chryseobacterium]|uniref:Uncharacterized protein n=1 Tax=Chryseobacterium gambrini TaxID=373672 RepID=A0A1N7LTB6_9FLAO|nr:MULTISPECIES: hypothetical protein [Chryseobacterium]MCY1663176.1 hypothetical protein [Chryseobacterium sp. SL1]SIS77093.1 hypothetical protein SAMN05421785_102485 [Chryseobacterium gambrini]
MKKVFFVAMLGVTGLVSAKGTPVKNLNLKAAKTIVSTKVVKKTKKTAKFKSTFVTYTSCGVAATTTQDWTNEQGQIWANMVEAIYCGHGY